MFVMVNRASRQLAAFLFLVAACSRPAPTGSTTTTTSTTPSTSLTPSSTLTLTPSSPPTPTPSLTPTPTPSASPLVTARPYSSFSPRTVPSSPSPLVLVLHGYGGTGRSQADYFGILDFADTKGFYVAFPDGMIDRDQKRYWNATDGCCDFDHRRPDDVAYLSAVLDDMQARFAVDPKRVYVMGLSNGGFMSHRLACDLSPRIAAIVSLAGAQWSEAAKCKPTSPVAVVESHEDADPIVRPDGGIVFSRPNMMPYPSDRQTVATWAKKNGCTGALTAGKGALDLNARVAGPDTVVWKYAGCPVGGDVELWSMTGGAHVPKLEPAWLDLVYAFFMSHPKP